MASLTENLTLLKNGKQKLINEVNNKLDTPDKEELPIDCEWTEIIDLMDKIKVKEDHSEEIDSNEIYSELCEGTYNKDIVTNVTNIPDYSFYYQEYLPKITGEHVTTIGQYAFGYCKALTEINFSSATKVNIYAFRDCSELSTINCPNINNLDTGAFYGIGTASINFPELTTIPNSAFAYSGITSGQFEKVTSIADYAFRDSKIEYVYLPKIATFATYSFCNCINLVTVDIPTETTYTINNRAFENCPSLETDLTSKAVAIQYHGITGTKIVSMNSNKLTSLSDESIQNNSLLETISFTSLITHTATSASICDNENLRTISLPHLQTVSSLVRNCNKLESIYMPEIIQIGGTGGTNAIIADCNGIESLSLPNASYLYNYGGYSPFGGIVANCDNIRSLDLANIKNYGCYHGDIYAIDNSHNQYLASNCKNLTNINLSKLQYCYDGNGAAGSYYGTVQYFRLFNKVGIRSQILPALTTAHVYGSIALFTNCYDLTEVLLPNLTSLKTWVSGDHNTIIIKGCPNLEYIELPKLDTILSARACFCSYYYTSANDNVNVLKYTKPYIEAKLKYYEDNVVDYLTNSDYRDWYEKRYGGFSDDTYDYSTNSPWNSGITSNQLYNVTWCGLKKIELPKLTRLTNSQRNGCWDCYLGSLCDCCTELEELWLGDGTSTFNSTLTLRFTRYCINLKKVILNYTNVIPLGDALTNVFMYSDYLTGTSRSIPDTGVDGTKYYYSNPSGIKACYFYVPDNLVDAYKSATNWATYADYIRPISELSEAVIDPSITTIEDNQFKDDQTLTTMSGYGITDIGNHAFDNTSATRLEFVFAKNIGSYAFANSTNLTKLIISYNEMTSVAEGTFMNTPLNVINVNNAITIDKYAFKDCSELSTVSISKAKYIDEEAFNNCTGLVSVSTPEIILVKDKAFKGCSSLNSIAMENLKTIESETFMNCNISSLNLPNVTTIKESAFENNNLISINIPNIAIIKDRAFAGNSNLTSINLYNIMSIGNNVFEGCDNLTSITFTNYSVPDHGNIPTTCTLHVRPELVTEFETEFPNNTVVGDVE